VESRPTSTTGIDSARQACGLHLVLLGLEEQLTQGGICHSTRKLQAGRDRAAAVRRSEAGRG
jgi:hypothetical protein